MLYLRSMDEQDMYQLMTDIGEPSFRARQLFKWIHNSQIDQLNAAHNVGKHLLAELEAREASLSVPKLLQRSVSTDGTEKYLLALEDGAMIESVLMKYRGDYSKQRNSLCVSSQVGCKMGCAFCATGQLGFTRSLSVAEILGQVYTANHLLAEDQEPMSVRNLVFMGMGEPFDNFDNVLKAIEILCHEQAAQMSQRRITISTCGIVPGIRRFADLNSDIGLAISLHATNDAERNQIMPVNHRYPLHALIEACLYYYKKTGRRISFEYALISGFNDSLRHVREMKALLAPLDAHVNVIPVNPVAHATHLHKPTRRDTTAFIMLLREHGVSASAREEKGADINGACGQLRAAYATGNDSDD